MLAKTRTNKYLRGQTFRRLYADSGVPLAGRQNRHVVEELLEAGDQVLAVARAIRDDVKDFVRHERRETAAHLAEMRRRHHCVLTRRQTRLGFVHLSARVNAGAGASTSAQAVAGVRTDFPIASADGDGASDGSGGSGRRRAVCAPRLEVQEDEARADRHFCDIAQKNGLRETHECHERAIEQRHFAHQNVHSLRVARQLLEEAVVVLQKMAHNAIK